MPRLTHTDKAVVRGIAALVAMGRGCNRKKPRGFNPIPAAAQPPFPFQGAGNGYGALMEDRLIGKVIFEGQSY